jgi:hypothetical protein
LDLPGSVAAEWDHRAGVRPWFRTAPGEAAVTSPPALFPRRTAVGETSVVDAARRALGPVGVVLPASMATPLSIDGQREAVGRLERAGYRAAWTNEMVGGKDALVQLAVLLAATERMTTARERLAGVLGRPLHAAAMARLGYSDQEIAEVSDRLVNAIFGLGDPAAIAAKVRDHLAAGAHHVTLPAADRRCRHDRGSSMGEAQPTSRLTGQVVASSGLMIRPTVPKLRDGYVITPFIALGPSVWRN